LQNETGFCPEDDALRKKLVIKNRVFRGGRVIPLPTAILDESGFFVKPSGGRIGLTDLKESRFSTFRLSGPKKFVEQPFSQALLTQQIGDNNVLKLPFVVENAANKKSLHAGLLITYQCYPARSFIGENALVLLDRPMGRTDSAVCQIENGGDVSGSGVTDDQMVF
jgi:hypothetical protein